MHTTPSSKKPIAQRIALRLGEYTTTGVGTFALDLLIVWFLLYEVQLNESLAIALGFLIAMNLNYLAQRQWVYKESPESTRRTYTYFIILACAGAAAIPVMVELTQSVTNLELLPARIIVGTLIGIIGFTFNTFFNFKFL